MREFEISCITRPRQAREHWRITHVGHLVNAWRMTREQVIHRIETQAEVYYLIERGSSRRSYLGVVREPGLPPYLRAHRDQVWNDQLLSLPRCSTVCDLVFR